MNKFLEEKLKMFDSVEEAFEDINDFVHKYNYLMNYLNKDYIYDLETTIKE
jgi:flagellar capping protein FliD